jgi:DNA-binding Lrp family transcriptional regulator
MIDSPVPGLLVELPAKAPLGNATSREVALALLMEGGPVGVRVAARRLERSPSTVSAALLGLRRSGLVDGEGAPLVPELFWALAGVWGEMVSPVGLAGCPHPGSSHTGMLNLGFHEPEGSAGWALRGPVAAAAWGARAPVSGGHPPDFFVPDERTVRVAARLFGQVGEGVEPACTVAAAPTTWLTRNRVDLAGRQLANTEWPAVQPVVSALDLALDPRGREVVEDFDPPEGWRRVW